MVGRSKMEQTPGRIVRDSIIMSSGREVDEQKIFIPTKSEFPIVAETEGEPLRLAPVEESSSPTTPAGLEG